MKKKLHSCSKEGGITEDVEHILGSGHEKCLSLFDTDAVDVGFSPEAYDDHEGIGMEIHFRGDLHNDSVDDEVRAMDKFGVGFGGVVRGSIFGPYLVIDSLLGLLDMEFTRFALRVHAPKVIDAIGDVRRLLYLDEEVTGTDSMETAGRQEKQVTLVRLVRSDDVLHRRVPVDSRGCSELLVFLGCDRALETGVNLGADIGFDDVPHLGFAETSVSFLRQFVIGVHLDGEVLAGVDELDEERELISELLIDAVANEESFVLIDELGEVEPEVHISDDASFDGYRFMTRYGTYLPRLADVGLSCVNAFERRYLVSAPDHGAEVGLKFVGFHFIDDLTIY